MTQNPKQSLIIDPADCVSLDDVKHRAEEISNLASAKTKVMVNQVADAELSKVALAAVGVVLVIASLAYLLGSRAGRRALSAGGE